MKSKSPLSIRTRMLWVITLLLILFFGVAGLLIDRNYVDSSFKAFKERLNVQLFALVAVIEETQPGVFQVAYPLQDFRVFEEGSGVYTAFFQNHGDRYWVSPSATGLESIFIRSLNAGERHTAVKTTAQGQKVLSLGLGVVWDIQRQQQTAYTLAVAQDMSSYQADVMRFRKVLWGGLATIGALLLIFQGVILGWGLRPLRHVVDEIGEIKSGGQQRIREAYPTELASLTENLNALLDTQQEHLNRHRHALDDLAHSLKTPLAVIQTEAEGDGSPDKLRTVLREQSHRMRDIIEHQLRRAATAGHMPLSAPLAIAPVVKRIIGGLAKVYRDKQPQFDIKVPESAVFYGDEGDLYELLGNLLDNACKWCQQSVSIEIAYQKDAHGAKQLVWHIDDDGPGIGDALKEEVAQRGARQENPYSGQGIGLAVVQDIVAAFHGRMKVEDSPQLGGARLTIILPSLE